MSVRLSVTRQYYVKTKKASVMFSSPSGSPTILVSGAKFHQNLKGVTPNGGVKQGRVGKISSFLSLSLNISKTVVTIND